ncbi:telomere length regulation TEL2 family protein isoform X2 [Carex rostrata]
MDNKEGKELENLALQKVLEVSSAIDAAKQVDEVICALHSVGTLIFSVDSSLISGAIDQRFKDHILSVKCATDAEGDSFKNSFYHGPAFPTMARLLLFEVAPNWLAQFAKSVRRQIYDSFFLEGPLIEVLEALVPILNQKGNNKDPVLDKIYSSAERLLVLCYLEKEGIHRMVIEFDHVKLHKGVTVKKEDKDFVSRVSQLLASIPDKTRPGASSKLSSFSFFKQVTIQLIAGAEEKALQLPCERDAINKDSPQSYSILFVGETFSRIIRRGSTDIVVSEMVPRIYDLVKSLLSSNSNASLPSVIESTPKLWFWLNLIETIRDQYSVERLAEGILRQLALRSVTDTEAYWILWLLFNRSYNHIASIRAMFVDKFLFWKVFPVSCLRWILQYSVYEEAPSSEAEIKWQKPPHFVDTLQYLVSIWSKREFVQSSSMEQQAYLTAAVGLCLEKMSKQELETAKDVLNSILQGVSCRLESPIDLVRKMASAIALTFSKVVDPKNPLYLDDNQCDVVDWEFEVLTQKKVITTTSRKKQITNKPKTPLPKTSREKLSDKKETRSSILIEEISDKGVEDEDKDYNSDCSSDTSLEPYDLSDDDSDLNKNFTQLGDIVAALKKTDDPDGVQGALEATEKLVRTSPDELRHNSSDLVRALVHVRCADVAAEGEEESSEEKRQKALVSLLVTCPFETLDAVTKLLYSTSVDISQRILILDVMTEAALELSETKIITKEQQRKGNLITSTSQPWFVPGERGPIGAGPWREISGSGNGMLQNWSHQYERELPSRPGQRKLGKTRKWSVANSKDLQQEWSKNRFPLYAAAFMLPAVQGFDKKRHGIDLLNRDFVVLGKLIYMLGVCMKCMAMHPEASALAPSLLDMVKSRAVSHHPEAYVRRSVLFAASCILVALHPSYVASALIEGNQDISTGLEWIRTHSLQVAEADSDTECASMAMHCLQLHSGMALETSRALESADRVKAQSRTLPSKLDNIIIPFANMN